MMFQVRQQYLLTGYIVTISGVVTFAMFVPVLYCHLNHAALPTNHEAADPYSRLAVNDCSP